jgi:hypothetical protein
MDTQDLASLLQKLRGELDAGPTVDENLRQSLRELDRDIQRLLARDVALVSVASQGAEDASLNDRAQELEARFSAEHPYLASTLRDVMDTLGKMGI